MFSRIEVLDIVSILLNRACVRIVKSLNQLDERPLATNQSGHIQTKVFRSGATGLDGNEKLTSLNLIEPEIAPVCEITHCAQNYTFRVQCGKFPSLDKYYIDAGGSVSD